MHYAELCKVVHIWYKLVVRVLWRTMDFSVGKVCMTSNKLRAGAHISEHNEILLGLRCWFYFFIYFIFFASRRNTRAKHHHSRNTADKGGESVVFPVVSLALSSFRSAKYGSLTAEKSSRTQKGQKKKKKKDPPCAWHWFLPIYGLPSGWLSPISWVIFGSRLEVLSVFFTWSAAVMWMDNEV